MSIGGIYWANTGGAGNNPAAYNFNKPVQAQPLTLNNASAAEPTFSNINWALPTASALNAWAADKGQELTLQQAMGQSVSYYAVKNPLMRLVDIAAGKENALSKKLKTTAHSSFMQPHLQAIRQTPTLDEIVGIKKQLTSLDDILNTGGKAYWQQLKTNFGGLFKANAATGGLNWAELLQNPTQLKNVSQGAFHHTFTRSATEVFTTGRHLFTSALSLFSLGFLALDTVKTTAQANAKARSQEDGSLASKLKTFGATVATLAREAGVHTAAWGAGTLGFTLGKALGFTIPALGLAAGWPAVIAGCAVGAVCTGLTYYLANQLVPKAV